MLTLLDRLLHFVLKHKLHAIKFFMACKATLATLKPLFFKSFHIRTNHQACNILVEVVVFFLAKQRLQNVSLSNDNN